MIFETRLTEREMLVEINQYGKSIHILKAAPVTRISVFNGGTKVLDTVVWQGMALGGIEFDQIIVTSDTPQEIAIWAARTPFDFKQVSTRQQTIYGEQKFIGNGIYPLLENDPARIIARLECDNDIWIGGQDLRVVEGVVQNGRKYKAGQEFELTAYGDVNCWITDSAEAVLTDNPNDEVCRVVEYGYQRKMTRTQLENLGIPYFDIDIPARMAGVPFRINVLVEFLPGTTKSGLNCYITKGDPSTEETVETGWVTGGVSPGVVEYEGNQHLAFPDGFSKGAHRVFMATNKKGLGGEDDGVDGDESTVKILKMWTNNDVWALGGSVQIMQERA